MVRDTRGYCNWEYTGEYETNKSGAIQKTEWTTDCGKTVYWTRDNRIGKLFKTYYNQRVPMGQHFVETN